MDAIWNCPWERFLRLPVALAVGGEAGDVLQSQMTASGRSVLRIQTPGTFGTKLIEQGTPVLGYVVDPAALAQLGQSLVDVMDRVPVVCVSAPVPTEAHLAMVELHIDGFLSVARGAGPILDLLIERYHARNSGSIRLLGVTADRSPAQMAFLADAAAATGFSCRLTPPSKVFEEIAAFRPELIVVDGRMDRSSAEAIAAAVAMVGSSPRIALVCKPHGVETPGEPNSIPAKTITVISGDTEATVQTVKRVAPVFRAYGIQARTMRRLSGVDLFGVEATIDGQLGQLAALGKDASRPGATILAIQFSAEKGAPSPRVAMDSICMHLAFNSCEVIKGFVVNDQQLLMLVTTESPENISIALRNAAGDYLGQRGVTQDLRFHVGIARLSAGGFAGGISAARAALTNAAMVRRGSIGLVHA